MSWTLARRGIVLVGLAHCCLAAGRAESPPTVPSAEQIEEGVAFLQSTAWLIDRYTERGFFTIEEGKVAHDREQAAEELIRSEAGATVFAAYCAEHPREHPCLGHLYGTLAGYPDLARSDLFARLLMSLLRSPRRLHLGVGPILAAMDFDTVAFHQVVWLSWLDIVDPRSLGDDPASESDSCDRDLFETACAALLRLHDPAGIPRVLEILEGAGEWRRALSPGLGYVATMGAREGFDVMAKYQLVRDCQSASKSVADESQALELYRLAYGTGGLDFPHGHPDLLRGLIPAAVRIPAVYQSLFGPRSVVLGRTGSSGEYGRLLADLPLGATALSDQEIVAQVRRALDDGDPGVANAWMAVLGHRDSTAGNEELLRWAMVDRTSGPTPYPLYPEASRSIRRTGSKPRWHGSRNRIRCRGVAASLTRSGCSSRIRWSRSQASRSTPSTEHSEDTGGGGGAGQVALLCCQDGPGGGVCRPECQSLMTT